MKFIDVSYTLSSTAWHNKKTLESLLKHDILSFDIETKGVYTKRERKLALALIQTDVVNANTRRTASIVAHNSGLSFPSLINVTHFIFGISDSASVILLSNSHVDELLIWKWISKYPGLLLIHNTMFDLKVMYHRVKQFPIRYEDTALMAKVLINDAESWKAKVDLKDLMGSFYTPEWTLIDEYEPENPKDPKFLRYASIDGAATYKLYGDLLEEFINQQESKENHYGQE